MCLKYEPSAELLLISVKQLFLTCCMCGTNSSPLERQSARVHQIGLQKGPERELALAHIGCRENSAHIRQSAPESGTGFQVKALEIFKLFAPHSAAIGERAKEGRDQLFARLRG